MTRISRHFNYTHRVRIPKSKVHVEVERGEDGRCRGQIKKLDLTDHKRHSETEWRAANVVVEARRVTMGLYHQQILGTVAEVMERTPINSIELIEFPDDSEIVFRFKVVDTDKKLLGEVDGIRSGEQSDTDRQSLIHLYVSDLKEELWRVDFTDDALGPKVLVNKRLPHARGLLTYDPVARGLILPQIVRQVLAEVVVSKQQSEGWVAGWIAFAERLGHPDVPDGDNPDAVEEWIDEVVSSFTNQHKFATHAEKHMQRAEEA
jgi:hypothetical protein